MGIVRDCIGQLHGHCHRICGATTWALSENGWFNYMGTVRECMMQLYGHCHRMCGAPTWAQSETVCCN